jgi:hypothetical protein
MLSIAALAPKAARAARSLRAGNPAGALVGGHAHRAIATSRFSAGIGSQTSDNDAEVLEREKKRSLECELPRARARRPG